MGTVGKKEHTYKYRFITALKEYLGKEYIIFEDLPIPPDLIIDRKEKKKNRIEIVIFRKNLVNIENTLSWTEGAILALIEIKTSTDSLENSIIQMLRFNDYFKADYIISTNYKQFISSQQDKKIFFKESNEFTDIFSIAMNLAQFLLTKTIIISVKFDINKLITFFEGIIKELSKCFLHNGMETLESVGFLYARELDIDTIKTGEDREEYSNSLLFITAHIFLTQLIFYRTLQEKIPHLGLPQLTKIDSLTNIVEGFKVVYKVNDESIFALNVVSFLQDTKNTLTMINLILHLIDDFGLTTLQQDLMGFLLQRLIPFNYRKKIAAFYTKPKAASLLAHLTINKDTCTLLDPACGSGSILAACYQRKLFLNNANLSKDNLEQIYGADISPFAITMATINLSLQANVEFSLYKQILLSDAFELEVELDSERRLEQTFFDTRGTIKNVQLTAMKIISKPVMKYKLSKVDLLITNPPFTKGDRMSPKYKDYLVNKLKSRHQYSDEKIRELIDKKQLGLHGYFLVDAIRYLKKDGMFAFILPYSVLYTESFESILQEIRVSFGFVMIVKSEKDIAFSDSSFEEIILIAKRNYVGNLKIVHLTESLEDKSFEDIYALANQIQISDHSGNFKEFKIRIIEQKELDKYKLTIFFHSERFQELWNIFMMRTVPITEYASELVRGNRVSPIDFYGIPNKQWKIIENASNWLLIEHKSLKTRIRLSKDILTTSIKRYNEMSKYPSILHTEEIQTYYIIPKDENPSFKIWEEANEIVKIRAGGNYPPIKRYTHLAIPQKISWNTTKNLAFYSNIPVHVGDGFMALIMDKENSFWTYCFLLSSYGIFVIKPLHRTIGGAFGQILGPDLKYIRIPNFKQADKESLKNIPSLAEQISKDIVEKRPKFIDVIRNAKKNHKSLVYLLDIEITKLLGLNEEFLEKLYDELGELLSNFENISRNASSFDE